MRSILLLLLLTTLAIPVLASDGTLEINQTCAVQTGCFPSDAPGLPVEITEPGSYRLTGRLNSNGSAVSAIEIRADDVTLDLGGFTVGFCQGLNPVFCQPGGSAPGIDGVGSAGVTVRNGIVADFAGVGVTLGPRAHVEDLLVRGNGGGGIRVLQDSLVESNRVFLNPGFGISFGTASGWGSNVLRSNVTNFIGEPVALSQNACSGRPCQIPGRRFYLTSDPTQYSAADAACADGYRMAFQAELTNSAALVYEEGLGEDRATALSASGGGRGYIADRCLVLEFEATGVANVFGEGQWLADDPGSCVFTLGQRVWCIQE